MEAHFIELFVLIAATQIVGWLFRRFGQPAVIGELLAGVIVGPSLLGWVAEGEILEFISELGAVFLLFMVGLETRLKDILSVGVQALVVALLGVALPFAGGYLYGGVVGFDQLASLFLGTALVATSVGITARVLGELGVISRSYSRIILGAAVIDDVLGLIVLAVVSGIAQTGEFDPSTVWRLGGLSLAFVLAAMALVPLIGRVPIAKLPVQSTYGLALILGIGFAVIADTIGLAPIIGAFLAGMVLAEIREEHDLEAPIRAVEAFLAPIFFAVVGLQLELAALASSTVLVAGSVVALIAILGKLVGGFLGTLREGTAKALVVGVGMVPRGEVGLIVAAIGSSAGAVNQEEYAIVIFMVVATTIVAPLALRPLIAWAERVPNPSKGVK